MEPYQLTKTIRFKLEAENSITNSLFDEKIAIVKDITTIETSDDAERLEKYIKSIKSPLEELLEESKSFTENLKKQIFTTSENEKPIFREKCPEVKYGFLKLYVKGEYSEFFKINKQANNKANNKAYKLTSLVLDDGKEKKVNFLKTAFRHWIAEWDQLFSLLEKTVDKLTNEQHNFDRRSEIAILIRRLNERMIYPFIRDFVLMTDSKTDHLVEAVKKLGNLLERCERTLIPTQADGMIVGRASFNYYTIHKQSKYNDEALSGTEKFDNEIHELSGERWLEKNAEEANLYRIIFAHFFDYNINLSLKEDYADKLFEIINKQLEHNPHHDTRIFSRLVEEIEKKLASVVEDIQQKETEYSLAENNDKKDRLAKRIAALSAMQDGLEKDKELLENTRYSPDDLAKLKDKNILDNLILLSYLYQGMKDYKATAKQNFYQAVQKGEISFSDLKSYPLFSTLSCKEEETEFNKFLQLSKDIENISTELNSEELSREAYKEKSAEKQLKCKDRGRYLTTLENNKIYFQNYVKFCDLFKNVALKRGQIKAKVKALEAEKSDSQRIQYWSVIAEKDQEMYLLLFPKMLAANNDADDNCNNKTYAQSAYETLSVMNDAKRGDVKLHLFESLTHRALEKLCFSGVSEGTNTFWNEVKNEINPSEYFKPDRNRRVTRHDPFNFIGEAEKIKFYQKVLTNSKAQQMLKGINFDDFKNINLDKDFGEDFYAWRKSFEDYTYVKHIKISGKGLKKLSDRHHAQVFKIVSSDLTKDSRNQSRFKAHTKLWREFWTKENADCHYKTRLNPEISISWREAKASRLMKYAKGMKYGERKSQCDKEKYKKNRFLHPQYTLRTTITKNASSKTIDTAFNEAPTVQEKMELFNKDLLTHDKDAPLEYVIGIDVGKVDLAAMTLFQRKDNYVVGCTEEVIKINQLEGMPGTVKTFNVWEIRKNSESQQYDLSKTYHYKKKKGDPKPRYIIDNPSYFAAKKSYEYAFPDGDYESDFNTFFKEKSVSGLDLTISKVIDGKIIVNGDLKTYLKLKERDARRLMCIILERHADAKLEVAEKPKGGYALYFKASECTDEKCNCHKPIYHYNQKYDIPDFTQPTDENVRIDKRVLKQTKAKLQVYLDNSNPSLLIEESKINHLCEALAANMVGVLHHIYGKHHCLIALEHLDHSTIESHRQEFSGNITRFLEWAVYRKFQSTYRVPPNIKDIITIRGTEKQIRLRQFGMVYWVDKESSKYCPACGKKSNLNYLDNKKNGFFDCEHCDFNTNKEERNLMGFDGVDDPDKVAAYNVGKLGYATYARAIAQLKQG